MIKKVKNKILLAIIISVNIISFGIVTNKVYSVVNYPYDDPINMFGKEIYSDYQIAEYAISNSKNFINDDDVYEKIGETIHLHTSNINHKSTISRPTATCMYHEQSGEDEKKYKIVNIIDINGRIATVHNSKSEKNVKNKKNAALAYSIYKAAKTQVEKVETPYKASIRHNFFNNKDLKDKINQSFITNIKNKGDWDDKNVKEAIKDADSYSNICGSGEDKPKKQNTTPSKSGNYIGPFKMSKGGFAPQQVSIEINNSGDYDNADCYYRTYDSDEKKYKYKLVDDEELESKKEFYVKCTKKNIQSWKVQINYETYKARMILLENPATKGQNLAIYAGEKETASLTWKGSTYGKIKITKKDSDTKSAINGATFSITGPNNYSNSVTITNNGEVTISDLKPGTYTITETGAGPGYNLSLQTNTVKTTSITNGNTSTVEFENKKYGNLKITKVDDYSKIPLKGVCFYVVYYKDDNWINLRDGTIFNYDNYEANSSYITNDKGEIEIRDIPTEYSYWIYELGSNNEELNPYYDFNSYSWKDITLNASENSNDFTEYYCENTQRYVDLSGYIWKDKVSGKADISNDLYNATDGDIDPSKINGIKIELVNSQTGQVVTQRNGVSCSTTSVDRTNLKEGENLSYRFCSVPMYDSSGNYILDKYYVRFGYNGLRYTSVNAIINQANGSKAKDVPNSRQELNDSFASIENENDSKKTDESTKGNTKNTDSKNKNNLKYESNPKWQSTLVQHTNYSPLLDNENGKYIQTIPNSGSKGIAVEANTRETGYNIERYKGTNIKEQLEIQNINLGIKEKTQVDLAIKNDISKVTFKMNGYEHVYNYSQRDKFVQKDENGELLIDYEEDTDKGYDRTLDGFLPEVKMDDKYKNMSYTREVYRTYPDCNKKTTDGKKKLKIYITYEVEIANQSNVPAIVNEISNYFDSDKLDSLDERKVGKIREGYREGYNKGIYEIDVTVKPYESTKITLEFEVKDQAIQDLLNRDATIENVVEINKYTTASGSIDKDSAPNNADPTEESTYEDDTDKAPGLTIKTSNIKSINGIVFEDDIISLKNSGKINEGKQRLGNGRYDTDDRGKVSNVKVDLIDKRTGELAYIYDDDGDSKATTNTDRNGKYEFKGIIPGEYILRYTYGNGDTTKIYYDDGTTKVATTQDYKSTVITSDILKNIFKNKENNQDNQDYWYLTEDIQKNQHSVAHDNYDKREEINKKYENINYNVQFNYTSDEIYADTPQFRVAIEDKEYEGGSEYEKDDFIHQYDNMNFGIVERPRQSIEITKNVSYIKLTLANGQVLAEGDPRNGDMQYISYPKGGTLKIEIDNELIQGAILNLRYEIKAENHSELDYNNEEYYVFAENKNDLVNIKIDKIVDYLDEDLVYDTKSTENKWERITSSELRKYDKNDKYSADKNNIADNVYDIIQHKNNIFIAEDHLKLQKINPEEGQIATFDSSKILYNTVGDLEFENFVEIIKYSNSVGRFYEDYYKGIEGNSVKSIPGNYIPSKDAPNNMQETDSNYNYQDNKKYNNPTTAIIPPTGQKRIYYVIGLTSLIILIIGIVIIKRKVL